ncbi:MAG: hypothetical protein ACR2OG_08440 [Gemmatimonadaceae bacterium]
MIYYPKGPDARATCRLCDARMPSVDAEGVCQPCRDMPDTPAERAYRAERGFRPAAAKPQLRLHSFFDDQAGRFSDCATCKLCGKTVPISAEPAHLGDHSDVIQRAGTDEQGRPVYLQRGAVA